MPPIVLLLGAYAWSVQRSSVLPAWTATIAWIAGALNVLSIPAAFGGSNPGGFYTATGFAGVVMGLIPLTVWIVAAAVSMTVA